MCFPSFKSCHRKHLFYCFKINKLPAYLYPTMTQSVASLVADPWVVSLIPAQSHTFVEIDHEIFSTVILLLLLIQKGWCQFLAKVCAGSTG